MREVITIACSLGPFLVVSWLWVRAERALRLALHERDMLEDVVRDHPGRRTPGRPVNLSAEPSRVTKGRIRQERRYWSH